MESEIEGLLRDAVAETGAHLQKTAAEVAEYAADRARHLSTLFGQPGFQEAVRAERDNVALYAGIRSLEEGEATDARLSGILQGALAMLAGASL